MFYCWMLLNRIRVFNFREELAFLSCGAAGAAIGWLGSTEILRFFPHL
jgi:hypothetical protein